MKYLLLLLLAAAATRGENYTYWVQPCSQDLARQSGCESSDPELAEWALDAWQRAAGGPLAFSKMPEENKARIRIYWISGRDGRYGEARPIIVDGKPGAAVYVRPDLSQLGPEIDAAGRQDRLFRHAIVYLTCLHESGHAIGLPHTAAFDDIMYSFGYGGDIPAYFFRYRKKLNSREDIRNHSGISPADQRRLQASYPK